MDLRLAMLKAVSFYLLHNVSTLNRCRVDFGVTVVCKHFASYLGYTQISHECISVISLESILRSSALHLVSRMDCWVIKLCYFSNRQLGSSLVSVGW